MAKNKPTKLDFTDFPEVSKVLTELIEKGIKHRGDNTKLRHFSSMADAYYNLCDKVDELRRKDLRPHRKALKKKIGLKQRIIDLKLDSFLAAISNAKGEVSVEGKTYNLLKKKDLDKFLHKTREAYKSEKLLEDTVENIICQKDEGGGKFCVSINSNTYLPSSKNAHTGKHKDSSYITRYFDKTINGDLVRFQIWKGHLEILDMTGAELSVWKPHERLALVCTGFFQCQWTVKEYFGLFWYPYVEKQFNIQWDFKKKNGDSVFTFGDTDYEQQRKWWAGKWLKDSEDLGISEFGKDYDITFSIKDGNTAIASGYWNGSKRKIVVN